MHDFGDIVLTRFPFTDLSGAKVRPALIVSRDNVRRSDVVLAFVTSNTQVVSDAVALMPTKANGLKVPSTVRFDKLATLERSASSSASSAKRTARFSFRHGRYFSARSASASLKIIGSPKIHRI